MSADAIIFNEAGLQVAVVENDVVHLRKVVVIRDFGQEVEAPVFGRPDIAAAGQLFVITAGPADAIAAAATPLFDAIGQKTFVVSETPKAANLGQA